MPGKVDIYVGSATIPGVVTSMSFFGDSFAAGGTDSLTNPYPVLTANLLGVTAHNYGVGGARNYLTDQYILTQVYQQTALPSSAPYAPAHQACSIQASINNLNISEIIADSTFVPRCLARAIRRLRSAGCYESLNTSRWSFTGTWATITESDANSNTGFKQTTADGSTWTLTTPSDFPGAVLRVYGPMISGGGCVHTVTVDGSAHGSIDTRVGKLSFASEPWEYPITLTAGAHTIVGTVSSLSSRANINGADFETTTVPAVAVLNTARSPSYPGSADHTTTDSDVTACNSAVASMLSSTFSGDPHVALVDIDTILGKNPANFGGDSIHPNDTGAGLIANALAPAITGAL